MCQKILPISEPKGSVDPLVFPIVISNNDLQPVISIPFFFSIHTGQLAPGTVRGLQT